jgi:hypothetical protein
MIPGMRPPNKSWSAARRETAKFSQTPATSVTYIRSLCECVRENKENPAIFIRLLYVSSLYAGEGVVLIISQYFPGLSRCISGRESYPVPDPLFRLLKKFIRHGNDLASEFNEGES